MNCFNIGFIDGTMIFKSGSHGNVARIMNDTIYDNAIVIDEDGTNNWRCTPPTSGDMLPKTQSTGLTPVSGTTYHNVWEYLLCYMHQFCKHHFQQHHTISRYI